MADFIATLAPGRSGNWDICKREGVWGLVGRGTNWRSNGDRVRAGDRVFVWRGGRSNGFIAQLEALGPMVLADSPGVRIPWDDPAWFGGIFPMRVVAELTEPVSDHFPNANGRNGVRFHFNNTVLQHIFEQIGPDVAEGIVAIFSTNGEIAFGVPYVTSPPPKGVALGQPFDVDPDTVDRALAAHHATLVALAAWVESQGWAPRLPASGEPLYDLAWVSSNIVNVAEVKSTTAANRESQLRLGLGQVLRYRQQLSGPGHDVTPWLVAENEVSDLSWGSTCADVGVRLFWPPFSE
jgi:hypothetical protein